MAIPGTFQTYDLATGVKLDVEDVIWLISPFDVPLQGGMGADGRTALSVDTAFEKKVEWLDEVLLTPKTTLAASVVTLTPDHDSGGRRDGRQLPDWRRVADRRRAGSGHGLRRDD